jgi:large subunit ribosomal protein L29
MKAIELRKKTNEDLEKDLLGLFQQAFTLRLKKRNAEANKKASLKLIKKEIARIKTILNERAGGSE